MRKLLGVLVAMALFSLSLFGADGLKIIKIDEAKKYFDEKSALFIDARPYKLFQAGTITGSMYMDYKEYDKLKKFLPADKKIIIVSFCNGYKCEHSDHLSDYLQKDGYSNVLVYKGGYPEWLENKYPVSGAMKECKDDDGVYTPKGKPVTIKGAEVYLIEGEKNMIDQFWFSKLVIDNLPKNIQLIDIRKEDQYKEGHLKGAINVPFADGKLDESKLAKDKLNVIYCNTGMQSTEAIMSLKGDKENVLFFDANLKCEGGSCSVTPNELLVF